MSLLTKPFSFDPRLESLRGLAALWVGWHHGFATFTPMPSSDSLAQGIVEFLGSLMTPSGSVILFFVLSGYVVGQSFLQSLDPYAYAIRRSFRLIPPFIASLLFAFVAMKLAGPVKSSLQLTSLYRDTFGISFGLQHFVDNLFFRNTLLNGPTWSIYPEIAGSVVLPFIVLAHAYVKPKWRWPLFLVLATVLAITKLRFVLWFYAGFFVVAECAKLIGKRKTFAWLSFVAGLSALGWLSYAPVDFKIGTVIASSAAATLMIAAIVSHRDFMTWLEWKPFRFLGRVSYSFYLIHWPIFYLCSFPIVNRPDIFGAGFNANLLISLTSIAVALAVSKMAYNYVELPSIEIGRRLAEQAPSLSLRPRNPA